MLTADQIHEEVDQYRRRLTDLFDEIRRWVTGRHPNATFSQTHVELSEEATDLYQAASLDVQIHGLPAVRFVPRGIFMVGAHGRLDARSRLGREVLVWLETGGAQLGGYEEQEIGRPLFPNIPQGWAWSDSKGNKVLHLDETVFWDRVLAPLTK